MDTELIGNEFGKYLKLIGKVRPRSVKEIGISNWMIGCETLDRDYADYDAYKEYLCPLGIPVIRLQGGWAKTEKVKGVYDFSWMDHIVEDALSRGLRPWIQFSYGNNLYSDGEENLGAIIPRSMEATEGFLSWVTAMVTRYKDKVWDWEVWNEPNFGDNKVNTPEITAELNIRTARAVLSVQPDARISALSMGHIDLEYTERFFAYLAGNDACGLFHDMTYHDYCYNPDSNHAKVFAFRDIVKKYAPNLIIRQGENGAPSVPYAGGALWQYDWTELSQAKWDLRRMLDNLGNGIECSVFTIAEIQYTGNGPIRKTNTKGLLETDASKRVIRPKLAYHAVQHVTSIFDDTLERVPEIRVVYTLSQEDTDRVKLGMERSVSVYGYRSRETDARAYTIWRDEAIPDNGCEPLLTDIAVAGARMKDPVLVELVSGNVYELKAEKDGRIDCFRSVPVYDSPVVIAEKELVPMI